MVLHYNSLVLLLQLVDAVLQPSNFLNYIRLILTGENEVQWICFVKYFVQCHDHLGLSLESP